MTFITKTEELQDALKTIEATDSFVTIDTEFLREETYWACLCLVQIAGSQETLLIDALSPDLSLAPLFAFMKNDQILKVFHAARQDLEIFYHLMGEVPQAIFDTQIAGMACGYGDQVGYEALVSNIVGKKLDKSQQYSNWAQRPLSDRQLAYARADVVHLKTVYAHLSEKLRKTQRQHWIEDEMSLLKSDKTYRPDPEMMWLKLRLKNTQPYYLARLKAIAALREKEAIVRNMTRKRLMSDDLLTEIAWQNPSTPQALGDIRGVSKTLMQGSLGQKILEVLAEANALPKDQCPHLDLVQHKQKPPQSHVDLLRILLKAKAEELKVAERLIATTSDLENFLLLKEMDSRHTLLHGWRYQVFGQEAWDIKEGKKGLVLSANGVNVIDVCKT